MRSAMKKTAPTTRPATPRLAKPSGKAMKSAPTVLSPTASWSPKAKMTGKTTSPARKATPKSVKAMVLPSRGRLESLER